MKSATIALLLAHCALSTASLPVKLETRVKLNSRIANIHVSATEAVQGLITFTYGSCSETTEHTAHHVVTRSKSAVDRLVWVMPSDTSSGGCLSAWDLGGKLVGRSDPQVLNSHSRKRSFSSKLARRGPNSIAMTNATGIDAWGPWFDGVELLESKNLSTVDVRNAKSKHIGIVGAGMSGLMTFLALTQAGMTNVELIEAGQRLGGRVHTVYLSGGPFDYSYQVRQGHSHDLALLPQRLTSHRKWVQCAFRIHTNPHRM